MFLSKSMSVRLLFFANTFLKFIFCSLDRYGPSLIILFHVFFSPSIANFFFLSDTELINITLGQSYIQTNIFQKFRISLSTGRLKQIAT